MGVSGAHTGDVSAQMLADIGAKAVIVGHSERRTDHGEDSKLVRQKARSGTFPRPGCHHLLGRDLGGTRQGTDH